MKMNCVNVVNVFNCKFNVNFFGGSTMKSVKCIVCLVALFGFCVVAGAAHIDVASVVGTAGPAPYYSWDNLINDSGMSGDTHTLADTVDRGDYGAGMGLTNNYPQANLVFDLGQNYQIDDMWIWNYSDHGPTTAFGIKNAQISYKADGGSIINLSYVEIGRHDGTTANAVDLIVDFEGVTARYVYVNTEAYPNQNWSGGQYNYCGLGEVRFYEVVPEPATMALLGLGGLLLRRKK
ncbi:MAG: hypothetical protein A2Y13_00660 [Planctomycetes bacterium GWC2_45_44]|nr:MAG: hypothetical protein A2Y13_00660 [Planctomycetes bacterium GWC2_45_44]HBR19003.1 hypothetical protein [Phycisphaerales bacterium]